MRQGPGRARTISGLRQNLRKQESRNASAAAVIGGLLLGYGARLAYGCNIGAYFSGIASGSLHGWVWLFAAFAGSAFGTRLGRGFGLGT